MPPHDVTTDTKQTVALRDSLFPPSIAAASIIHDLYSESRPNAFILLNKTPVRVCMSAEEKRVLIFSSGGPGVGRPVQRSQDGLSHCDPVGFATDLHFCSGATLARSLGFFFSSMHDGSAPSGIALSEVKERRRRCCRKCAPVSE